MVNSVGSVLGRLTDVLQCMGIGYICKCGYHSYSVYFKSSTISVTDMLHSLFYCYVLADFTHNFETQYLHYFPIDYI
jgi:hypothetical protein